MSSCYGVGCDGTSEGLKAQFESSMNKTDTQSTGVNVWDGPTTFSQHFYETERRSNMQHVNNATMSWKCGGQNG